MEYSSLRQEMLSKPPLASWRGVNMLCFPTSKVSMLLPPSVLFAFIENLYWPHCLFEWCAQLIPAVPLLSCSFVITIQVMILPFSGKFLTRLLAYDPCVRSCTFLEVFFSHYIWAKYSLPFQISSLPFSPDLCAWGWPPQPPFLSFSCPREPGGCSHRKGQKWEERDVNEKGCLP